MRTDPGTRFVHHLPKQTSQAFTYAIERSCVNKAEVVAADEKEGGVRATLNLGHTFGHAIETCTGEGLLMYVMHYSDWLSTLNLGHTFGHAIETCMGAEVWPLLDLLDGPGWAAPYCLAHAVLVLCTAVQ